jgi:hypothetical protein
LDLSGGVLVHVVAKSVVSVDEPCRATRAALAKGGAVRGRREAISLLEASGEVELARVPEALGDLGDAEIGAIEEAASLFEAQELSTVERTLAHASFEESTQVLFGDVDAAGTGGDGSHALG